MTTVVSFPLVAGASVVPESERLDFLPKMLGGDLVLIFTVENLIYSVAQRICPDYQGGSWEFVSVSDGLGFAYPTHADELEAFTAFGENFKMDKVSFGIACTLYAFNHAIWHFHDKGDMSRVAVMDNLYHRLRHWLYCDKTDNAVRKQLGADTADKKYSAIYRVLD